MCHLYVTNVTAKLIENKKVTETAACKEKLLELQLFVKYLTGE